MFLTFLFNAWRQGDSDTLSGTTKPSKQIHGETWTKIFTPIAPDSCIRLILMYQTVFAITYFPSASDVMV